MILKVIGGGGESLDLQPKLVKRAEDNALCLQVSLGQYEATIPLPEHIDKADEASQKLFMQNVVPEMVKGLREMASKDRRKLRRKAKK